ncbi:MAG: multidrug effflux MFS transporter, partial [Bacteroidota bacterium]|nr:multidrug effflux MFS transporter [Bacteroidota bacterium]
MNRINNRSKRQGFFLILILGALETITPISIDMYLPAFPRLVHDFHTDIGKVSLSVSTYFLGFAIGEIVYGPLLDRFGRKRPVYIGLALYVIATIICGLSNSIDSFLVMRFLQALSGCVASVAAIAMVRDFFPVDKTSSILSFLFLIVGVSPMLAPTIGSFIVTALGWRYVFAMLAIVASIMIGVVFFFLPEGHQPDTSVSLKPKPIINGFKQILFNPKFYVFTLAGTFSFAGLFVYVAGSPEIFMNDFHVGAKIYGVIFAFLSIGFIGSSQLNHILSRKYSNEKIFKATVIVQVIFAGMYLFGVLNGWYGLLGHIGFLFVILSCTGLAYPNAAAMALSPFSDNAGRASALLGFLQIGIGGFISSGVGVLHFKGSVAVSLIMMFSSA